MDLKAPNSKFFGYQPEVIEIPDTDDELITVNVTEYEYSEPEIASGTSKWSKISMATSNNRGVQRELSAMSCESNSTNNSGSVFNTPLSKSSSVCEIGDTFK
ncbi:4616_t:CDS:2, partial [Cetraspora pellucida]